MTTPNTVYSFISDYENQKKLSNHFAIPWIDHSISILYSNSVFLNLYMISLLPFFFLPIWYTNDTVFFKTVGITGAINLTFPDRNWTVYLHKLVSNLCTIPHLPEMSIVFLEFLPCFILFSQNENCQYHKKI